MDVKKYLEYWDDRYVSDLTTDIIPFWLKNGLDKVNGGVYTCLDRDGSLMDSTKSVWFQGRFGFNMAYAYNEIEKNPEWLAASKSAIDFIEKYCFDTDGRMFFEISADGVGLRKRRYVFSETFAIIAMAEYARATGDMSYGKKAIDLLHKVQTWINTPGFLPAKYTDAMQGIGHSVTMILVNTAARVRDIMPDDASLTAIIDDSVALLRDKFMHPEYKALLETVAPDGGFIDTINGRLINPGHCIETSWFILEEAKYRAKGKVTGRYTAKELQDMALTILEWSWKWGWDEQYGGIINFRDCKGYPQQDYSQDMKFWWPQNETIIATLYAYQATGDEKWLEMHKRISDWTYAHFPDPEYGEWFGYLHRDGSVAQPAKGNIFKGPFHVARMMIKCHQLCQELLKEMK